MNLAAFATLLRDTMGLDAASIGSGAIERAVRERMRMLDTKDPARYLADVHASRTELQELIETVTVPETWFFRDRQAFVALTRAVREEWLRLRPGEPLRLLSLPCATGEEPYSMAIALLDAGIGRAHFRIDAIDIGTRVLAHAERGSYGANSFRGRDLEFRDTHLTPAGARFQVSSTLRECVIFQQGNLLDPEFLPGERIYDAIFCRNLLIYFNDATQARAVRVLERLLKTDGWLFVGPAETNLLRAHDFVAVKAPLAFAFRKRSAAAAEAPVRIAKRATAPAAPPRVAPVTAARPTPPRPQPSTKASAPVAKKSPAADTQLAEALRLADTGQLAEAARLCDTLVAQHGPSAQACYVSGLVRDASGNAAEARELYRRAIYLDPNHQEALVHLAILLEQQGDADGARLLLARARRAQSKKAS